MAKGFRRVDRDQQFLMPPDMREWLPADHLVWFVVEVVGLLDLDGFRARHRLGGVGREAYDPAMLLTLLIYGYAVGVHSSRQIQRLCDTDVAFRVICAGDVPDHTTIARFRHAHVEAFDGVFAQVLRLCAGAGMGRLGTVAIDGTKIAANASIDANHGRDWFGEQARRITAQAEDIDAAEDALFGEGRRGDELPAELADPGGRKARITQILAEMDAEQARTEAENEAERAQRETRGEQHVARLAAGRVTGRDPAGVDPVAAAAARLARELVTRQGEIDADGARVAAAAAQGRRLSGRRVVDPLAGKAVRKARAALQHAQQRAQQQGAGDPTAGDPTAGDPTAGDLLRKFRTA